MELLVFVVISIIAIVSALGAILVKSPIHVMVWFLGFILSVAASFFALKADC
jgi:hypothetical protein